MTLIASGCAPFSLQLRRMEESVATRIELVRAELLPQVSDHSPCIKYGKSFKFLALMTSDHG